jgi:hypothetical protein
MHQIEEVPAMVVFKGLWPQSGPQHQGFFDVFTAAIEAESVSHLVGINNKDCDTFKNLIPTTNCNGNRYSMFAWISILRNSNLCFKQSIYLGWLTPK